MPLRGHKSTSFSTPLWALAVWLLVPLGSICFGGLSRAKGFELTWGFIIMAHRTGWTELNPCYLQFIPLNIHTHEWQTILRLMYASSVWFRQSPPIFFPRILGALTDRRIDEVPLFRFWSGVLYFSPHCPLSIMLFSHHHPMAYTIPFYILTTLWFLFWLMY